MLEIEDRIRRYAEAAVAATEPITVDEVASRGRRSPALRWLTVAAITLVVLGLVGLVTVDREETRVATTSSSFPLTLDGHLEWNLALLNGEIDPSDAEIESRYTDAFIAAVPAARVRSIGQSVRDMAPWRLVVEIERRGEEVLAVQLVSSSDRQARLSLHRTASGKLDASTILFAVPCAAAVDRDTKLSDSLAAQRDWFLRQLEPGARPSDDELMTHMAPSFLAAVPPERTRAALASIQELAPLTFRVYEGTPQMGSLTARLGVRTGEEARLTLAIEPKAPYRITGATVLTQQPCIS